MWLGCIPNCLPFEAAARKAGISDSHEFQEILQLLRLRALADLYRRNLEKQYETLPQEEIAGYYHREIRRFEEVKLRRIVLPKNNFAAANKEQFEKQALQYLGISTIGFPPNWPRPVAKVTYPNG
jgi:hypothetical protein